MSQESTPKQPDNPQDSALSKFRDEMAKEIADLKADSQAKIDELTKEVERLTGENKELNREIVRLTVTPNPAPPEDPLSPEEKAEQEYRQEVKNIFEKSLKYSGRTINGN